MNKNSVGRVLDEEESAEYREFVRGWMDVGTTPKNMHILFCICRMNQWCPYQTFQSLVGAGVFGDDWLQGTATIKHDALLMST